MGVKISNDTHYALLDLAIVSPDMYKYRNRFREANRSFGELIIVEYGQKRVNSGTGVYYGRVSAAGEFGIDTMQDFAHSVLGLQPVNYVNDLVRMPANTWIGFGYKTAFPIKNQIYNLEEAHLNFYLGTDRLSLDVNVNSQNYCRLLTCKLQLGLSGVAYDEIVSAPPISAGERKLIPYIRFRTMFDVLGYRVFVNETISLPTIKSDRSMFAVLNAGVVIDF